MRLLEKHDTKQMNYLVVGPWNHGGWATVGRDASWATSISAATRARYFREEYSSAVVCLLAERQGHLPLKEALTFETGSNDVGEI